MNGTQLGPSRTPWGAIFSLITALLYGASPIDLIPDVIPLLGWVVDAIIVPLFLIIAFAQWHRAKKRTTVSRNGVIVMPPQDRR